jgi:hypothetical protein
MDRPRIYHGQGRQFSLRVLLIALTLASLCFGAAGFVLQNLPRWEAELAKKRTELARQRAAQDAEDERLQKLDLAAGQELIEDIRKIKAKIGRYPYSQAELEQLRGKPMPMTHSNGRAYSITYEWDGRDISYCLHYFGTSVAYRPRL